MDVEGDGDRRLFVFADTGGQGLDVDVRIGQYLRDVDEEADTVCREDLELGCVGFLCVVGLPLSLDEAGLLVLRQVHHIDAVRAVDRDATATGDESDDFIARHRRAALRVAHGEIMNALHHDTGLRLPDDLRLLRHALDVVQDILVRDIGLIRLML